MVSCRAPVTSWWTQACLGGFPGIFEDTAYVLVPVPPLPNAVTAQGTELDDRSYIYNCAMVRESYIKYNICIYTWFVTKS